MTNDEKIPNKAGPDAPADIGRHAMEATIDVSSIELAVSEASEYPPPPTPLRLEGADMSAPRVDLCPAFICANDHWTPELVAELDDHSRRQNTPREQGAALFIGAGFSTYMPARVNASRFITCDLHSDVTTFSPLEFKSKVQLFL